MTALLTLIEARLKKQSTGKTKGSTNFFNWRNKEVKMKTDVNINNRKNIEGEHYEEVAQANNVPPKDCGKENGEIVTFEKTYSFRKLPKGRVAKLQKQFEASGFQSECQLPSKQTERHAPRYKSSKQLTINKDTNGIIKEEKYSNGISVPIRSWEDASYSSASQSSIQSHTR